MAAIPPAILPSSVERKSALMGRLRQIDASRCEPLSLRPVCGFAKGFSRWRRESRWVEAGCPNQLPVPVSIGAERVGTT